MATFGEASEWESATTLGQHTHSSSGTTLQTHGQRHSPYYTFHFTWRVNRRYRFNVDTVSHTGVYVMAIGSLIPAGLGIFCCYFFWCRPFQISVLIFTTRYYAIYNCGWWCRGSTHLQIQWQGFTADKTSWESWPVYRVYTYMDGESMQAADTVISSSCKRIIGKYFQNPGNTEMYIISAVRLRTHHMQYPTDWLMCHWTTIVT